MTRRRISQVGLAFALIAAVTVGVRSVWGQYRPVDSDVPTTRVQRGTVDMNINATGELRTTKSTILTAPPVGGTLRLVQLHPTGAAVKAGDVVMAFDPSDQEDKLEEARSQVLEADLEIEKLKLDAAVQNAQDKVNLLTTQFDVKKAELDVTGNELLSAIKARQNELTLEEARRKLSQLQDDIASHATTSVAAMAVAAEKRTKARLAMDSAERLIASLVVKAPSDGIVSVSPNQDGVNIFFMGMVLPEYREGDNVSSGRQVAELLDIAKMEFVARVPETERASVAPGQKATLTLDGLSAATLAAQVTNVGVARGGSIFFGRGPEGPVRLVDVSLVLSQPLATARPGLTAKVQIASEPLKNVLYVPRQAIFERDGKPMAYVKVGNGFEPRPVKVSGRTETLVVLSDLPEGTEIALANPEQRPGQKGAPTSPATPRPATT